MRFSSVIHCAAAILLALLAGCGTPPARITPVAPARTAPLIRESAWRTEAQKWLGTPYRAGGTNRSGVDCSALTSELYRAVTGRPLPRTTGQQFQLGEPVSDRELRPGDLVFFQTGAQPISHVGVWLGNLQFVHASSSRGVIISSLREGYYSKRFRGARRLSIAR